ncbi:MAG: hypothetical protein HQL41_10105 [Alphaproteobacteria bacterium]|nr:hypothetical protein [Alphaproteobacteria bacterium]
MLAEGFRKNFWFLSLAKGVGALLGAFVFMFLASWLGAGVATDAFFLVRRFATGLTSSIVRASNLLLVPSLVAALVATEAGRPTLGPVRTMVVVSLAGWLSATAMATWSEPLVRLLAPGFPDETVGLAAHLLRIMAFLVPLTIMASIAASHMNAARRFALAEYAGQLPRIALLTTVLLLPVAGVDALAWAMLTGSAAYLAVLLPPVLSMLRERARRGAALAAEGDSPPADTGPGIGRRLSVVGLTQVEVQGVAWIDAAFASLIGIGAVSMLEYAQRLVGLLPSLLSTSLISIAYTEMSYAAAHADRDLFRRSTTRIMRANLFLILPVAVAATVGADLLVEIFLHHGRFSAEAAAQTTRIVHLTMPYLTINSINAAAIAALVADASAEARRILLTAIVVMLGARLVIFLSVVGPFGLAGIVLGSGAALALGSFVMFTQLSRHCGGLLDRSDRRALVVMLLAAGLAALAMQGARMLVGQSWEGPWAGDLASLALCGAAAGVVYLGVCGLAGLSEVDLIAARLRRRVKRQASASIPPRAETDTVPPPR